MSKKITGTEIKNNVKRKISMKSFDKAFTNAFIDEIIFLYQKEIIKSLLKNDVIEIRGFMTFYVKEINRKTFRNPKTGIFFERETLNKSIGVRIGDNLKNMLNHKD